MTISKTKLKLTLAGVLVASAFGASFLRLAWATPGAGVTSAVLSGALLLDEIDTKGESDSHEIEIQVAEVPHTPTARIPLGWDAPRPADGSEGM